MSYNRHFMRFLGSDPERLHVVAHSHHPWPDITDEADIDELCARLSAP